MENLTSKEIDILIEALDVWEKAKFLGLDERSAVTMTEIFINLMMKNEPPEVIDGFRREMKEQAAKEFNNKEVSILLKAKLIGIKQSSNINNLMRS